MLELQDLLAELEYDQSPYYLRQEKDFEPEMVHLFRAARDIKVDGSDGRVDGIYVFETSPESQNGLLSPQPAVYVATAKTVEGAQEIHRSLWNLCYAPFLIVTLPHQIRIYTGFNYSWESENVGLLSKIDKRSRLSILKYFASLAIDTKQIWQSDFGKKLNPNNRVDKRLLKSLRQLGDILKDHKLSAETAHALIGKYVYYSYLRDRNILSDQWLNQQGIEPQEVFSFRATVSSLRKLTEAIEARFNGKIFPIEFDSEETLEDKHVSWVASVFSGDRIEDTPEVVRQLHLPFSAYNFKYIPVETLSTIYEQFIHERKKKGAIYTPEILADYLISEMEWAKKLEKGMRILDPACGSGVFLVLAYRRLIEKELKQRGVESLSPEELRDILLESIYGVEKELDACYVTEFSLILTLLHYVKPSELHKNLQFQFPSLHNERIYHCDFFDPESPFAKQEKEYDWIVGNPPWIKADKKEQSLANQWIIENKSDYSVGDKSVAEAFSWHVGKFLKPNGLIGLLMPATSLVNLKSSTYRQQIFSNYEFLRVTNFANLREVLFDKRGTLPAATFIYQNDNNSKEYSPIIHYGPFSINQITDGNKKPWVITVNENEIQYIDRSEAILGNTNTWKLALWGNPRDKRLLERLDYLYKSTLEDFCKYLGWGERFPRQGAELTEDSSKPRANVEGERMFDTQAVDNFLPRYRFSIPDSNVLKKITGDWYIRRGEDTLYLTTPAPHLILSVGWQKFAIYSDEPFVVPPRQLVISCPDSRWDKTYLMALAAYLSSSLVAYYVFFNVPEWGFFRQRKSVVTSAVRQIPIPYFDSKQAEELANLYRLLTIVETIEITEFVEQVQKQVQDRLFEKNSEPKNVTNLDQIKQKLTSKERKEIEKFSFNLNKSLQDTLDRKLKEILNFPDELFVLSKEFVETKLTLDTTSAISYITSPPSQEDLLAYARKLQQELDNFTMNGAHHDVKLSFSSELIECMIEIKSYPENTSITEQNIKEGDSQLFVELRNSLQEQISQWAYVQRGLRLFDGNKVYIYKPSRLIDWTQAQAIQDASDIISSALTPSMNEV